MVLDVQMNSASLSLDINDPYRIDAEGLSRKIDEMASTQGIALQGLDVRGLLPRMVRGVAGCEEGCPANAKELVERGYGTFDLQYVEGGILTASARTADGKTVRFKLFPDF